MRCKGLQAGQRGVANRGVWPASGRAAGFAFGGLGAGHANACSPLGQPPAYWGGGRARPAPSVGASQLRLGLWRKTWRKLHNSDGRSRLRHQGHVPLQADLGAEPRRGA